MGANYHLDWLRRVDSWHYGQTNYGGLELSAKHIKISSRTVQELLAGELDHRKFLEQHSDPGGQTPFRRMLAQGRLIKNVRIEKSDDPEDDDDWLVFEFGEPDPAVMPFVARRRK